MQRPGLEVGGEDGLGAGRPEDGRLDSDRHAVGEPQPPHDDDARTRLQLQAHGLLRRRLSKLTLEQARRRSAMAAAHLGREVEEVPGLAVRGRLGDEGSAARHPLEQALLGEALDGLARRHPADRELLAELRVRGQRVTGLEHADPGTERLLDLVIAGDERAHGASSAERSGR